MIQNMRNFNGSVLVYSGINKNDTELETKSIPPKTSLVAAILINTACYTPASCRSSKELHFGFCWVQKFLLLVELLPCKHGEILTAQPNSSAQWGHVVVVCRSPSSVRSTIQRYSFEKLKKVTNESFAELCCWCWYLPPSIGAPSAILSR